MITIHKNEKVEITEIDESIVQKICNVFLIGGAFSVFHPVSDGAYRSATLALVGDVAYAPGKRERDYYGFEGHFSYPHEHKYIHFNENEMRMAFKELIKAGYHMYRVREYGTWLGYVCKSCKNYNNDEVTDFNEHWSIYSR